MRITGRDSFPWKMYEYTSFADNVSAAFVAMEDRISEANEDEDALSRILRVGKSFLCQYVREVKAELPSRINTGDCDMRSDGERGVVMTLGYKVCSLNFLKTYCSSESCAPHEPLHITQHPP
jgi:hypothetical protein